MTTETPTGTAILRLLRWALHTGFLLLLAIATVRVFASHDINARSFVALAGALVLAAIYSAGPFIQHRAVPRRAALAWLATVTAVWALLLLLSPDFAWVAFPLFFLHLHLLRRRHAVAAVAVQTGLVVATQQLHYGSVSVAMVLGPALGAVFAVVIALGYAALYAESEQRRRLIDDLTRTRTELAASQHQAGVLAERERLAREIHDTLAQGLSSIILLLRSAESAAPEDAEVTLERIDEARQSASANLAEARRFVRDLTPPALTSGSLTDALRRLCERTEGETGITCHLRLDGEPRALPGGYDIALLRAAQASLANVTTHARADTAVVTLSFLETQVTLDIYDNGVGFHPRTQHPGPPGESGFGLTALHDRIDALGGRLDIESTPGAGTVVAVSLALTGEEIS